MILFVNEEDRNINTARELIKTHTALPYSLSLHQFKSDDNICKYLKTEHDWVFNYLKMNNVVEIIHQTKSNIID